MEDYALFLKSKRIPLTEYDFKRGSTIGVGGTGKAVFPRSFTEMIDVVDGCERLGVPYKILGALSNVLPPERENGTLYVLTKKLVGITMGQSPLVYAGVTVSELLRQCKANGKGGAEFLAGIPCTVGGAAYMNAGVSGRYFEEIVHSVITYEKGELKTYTRQQCAYAYKHSRFMDGGVILAVILNLTEEDPRTVSKRIEEALQKRNRLPKGKSMGCVFKNPTVAYAGELIERAGFKGLRVGGAVVSEQHANFIINDRGASVADIKQLIAIVKAGVAEKFGVSLTEEIGYL